MITTDYAHNNNASGNFDTNGFVNGVNDETAQSEGKVARAIEKQTAKLPSDLFLWAAGGAIVASIAFQVVGMTERNVPSFLGLRTTRSNYRAPLSTFVAHWAPTLLLLGLYNKLVKVAGSDRINH